MTHPRTRLAASAVILSAVLFGASPVAAQQYDLAIAIGNKNYDDPIPDVEFAHNDAEAFARYATEILGLRPGNVVVVRDAGLSDLVTWFGNAQDHQGKVADWLREGRSKVYVYYSGHGVPGRADRNDRRGYLLPVNADPDRPHLTGFPIEVLTNNLGRLESPGVTVFLDACFSGESEGGQVVSEGSPWGDVGIELPDTSRQVTLLTAATGAQIASWDRVAQHGLFTAYLLRGLYGEADRHPWGNRDQRVTMGEVRAYLQDEMRYCARRTTARRQQPSLQGDAGRLLATLSGRGLALPVRKGLCFGPPPPLALDDRYDGLAAGETHRLDVLRNDRSQVAGGLRIVSVSAVSGASVTVTEGGQALAFRTDATQAGSVRFRYRITDVEGGEAEASVVAEYLGRRGCRAGEERTFEGIAFVCVPSGSFEMGCGSWAGECYDDEKPVHRVTLDGFWLGKYEVTQAEWTRVMGSDPSGFAERSDDHPVESVSWDDIQGFLRRLNGSSSGPFRLPSESEWEYACRSGGKEELYCGGSDLDALAWYGSNSGSHTNPVGRKRPNGLGLHDMSGNVWEWVQDCWNGSYNGAPNNGNSWTSGNCGSRVLRGGSWGGLPRGVRSAYRFGGATDVRDYFDGFRVARTF